MMKEDSLSLSSDANGGTYGEWRHLAGAYSRSCVAITTTYLAAN